ncbi:hypothetical protein EXIGLDRAFT_751545 [Exidia glandulosa HHB12029]|uniref:Uncharacterized protein n=1 Tax=Exidia glandulosa HHB12029 TaxID=1314781 RepID=A0A165FB10_EXIGL|nr:hypothetical protein EXIGLDRAFT_751545 [Exidia glandulosa HHB12029]
MPHCNVCKREFRTHGNVARHVRSSDCKTAFKARFQASIPQLRAEVNATRDRGSDDEPDPPWAHRDGLNLVYGTPQPETAFDMAVDNSFPHQSPDTSPSHRSFTAPPTQPAPVRDYRTTVEDVLDEEDASYVECPESAGAEDPQLRVPRVEAHFASFGADSPWGPFASEEDWEFAQWAKTEAVSAGAVTRLMKKKVLRGQLTGLKSVKDINDTVAELPSPARFHYREIRLDGTDETFDLFWRNALDVVRDLFADPTFAGQLKFVPERHYADRERLSRLYNEFNSGDWWWQTQVLLPDGATVVRWSAICGPGLLYQPGIERCNA